MLFSHTFQEILFKSIRISYWSMVCFKRLSSQAMLRLQVLLWSNELDISHDLKVNVFGLQKQGSGNVFKLTFDGNGRSHVQADMWREGKKTTLLAMGSPSTQTTTETGEGFFLPASLVFFFFIMTLRQHEHFYLWKGFFLMYFSHNASLQ